MVAWWEIEASEGPSAPEGGRARKRLSSSPNSLGCLGEVKQPQPCGILLPADTSPARWMRTQEDRTVPLWRWALGIDPASASGGWSVEPG